VKSFRTFTLCIAAFASTFLLVSSAFAQDTSKGSITGIVRDPSGAIITGAKMTLSTPQGDRMGSTNAQGQYSFTGLVPGTGYSLTAEKTGFSTGRLGGLAVSVNAQTTGDIALAVGQTATTVDVVSGGAGTIDLSSTTTGATLDESLYKNVPAGRNISAIINFSPGVTDSVGAGAANPSINGASGLENQYNIDGADVTDPGYGGFGTYSRSLGPLGSGVNFDFVQQVQVMSGGFDAQYGEALGGVINVQTKSGTNNYHGAVYGFFQPIAFEGTRPNINNVITNKVTYVENKGSTDYGGDLGGYLKKDKLFFFIGFNPTRAVTAAIADPAFSNYALGTQFTHTNTYNYVAKLTWNLNDRHTVDASVYGDPATSPVGFQTAINSVKPPLGIDTTIESGLDYGSRTWTVRYNGAMNNHWLLTGNYSDHYNTFTQSPLANGFRITDSTPSQEKTGGSYSYGGIGLLENFVSKSRQVNIGSSNTFSWLGGHNLDYGFQYENQPYSDIQTYSGGDFTLPNLPAFGAAAGATMHGAALTRTHQVSTDPTSPIVLRVTRGNYSSQYINVGSNYTSGYVQDSWTMGRHLTAKLGLRLEQQSMHGTYSSYVFAHNWAPRFRLIYDPTGSRKSKIYGNWGRFYEKIPQDIAIRAMSFETSVIGALYKDPGPGLQPNLSAANYVGGTLSFQGSPDDTTLIYGGTRAQYQDEYVFGYDREFNHGLTFSGRYVRRDLKRIIEDTSGINVTQANAGVTQQYVISNPSASLDIFTNAFPCTGGLPKCDPTTGYTPVVNPLGSDGIADGFPDAVRIYKSMELVVNKRFSRGYQFFANYTLSSLTGNYQGNYRSDNGQTDPNISSLFDFTNSDGLLSGQYTTGPLPSDRRHQIKLYGNKSWKALNFGLAWSLQSGTPITKLLDHPVYLNQGEVPSGARGALGRTAWILPLNLHADYTIRIKERMSVKLIADLFNVMDTTKVIAVNQYAEAANSPGTPNVDFLKPSVASGVPGYQTPFNARLGVRFEF
jgi:hypothetical protein